VCHVLLRQQRDCMWILHIITVLGKCLHWRCTGQIEDLNALACCALCPAM
jgi:hypothetical protein